MPTYEYACTSCHAHIEVVQRFSEEPLTVCDACGGALKRIFHPVGIVLKGSGFYATDNRGKKPTAPVTPAKDAPSTPTADKKTESKSESKSESKPSDSKTANKTDTSK